jgi:hypothetical protein
MCAEGFGSVEVTIIAAREADGEFEPLGGVNSCDCTCANNANAHGFLFHSLHDA